MNRSSTKLQHRSPPARPACRTDVTLHELDGEALIFDATSGDTHRLNETAYFIWRTCDGTRDLTAIADALCDAYDVAREAAEEHVREIVTLLAERKLLVDPS
ncbi:MAG: HPr-rel-A system PqqD family peptide chaperone [Phycisphaerales bacterium]|nr:MAG: HPr-rel-A system PqqD family peptide chaperone [Phycisphaerales bacterium]